MIGAVTRGHMDGLMLGFGEVVGGPNGEGGDGVFGGVERVRGKWEGCIATRLAGMVIGWRDRYQDGLRLVHASTQDSRPVTCAWVLVAELNVAIFANICETVGCDVIYRSVGFLWFVPTSYHPPARRHPIPTPQLHSTPKVSSRS